MSNFLSDILYLMHRQPRQKAPPLNSFSTRFGVVQY